VKGGISRELGAQLAAYQDALQEAEAQGEAAFTRVFENPPPGVGVHEIDKETRVLRANDEDLRILGYTREEFVGRPVVEFIVMDETARRAIGRKLEEERPLTPFVRTFKRKDGTPIPLVLLDRHLRDATGTIVGLRTVLAKTEDDGT